MFLKARFYHDLDFCFVLSLVFASVAEDVQWGEVRRSHTPHILQEIRPEAAGRGAERSQPLTDGL